MEFIAQSPALLKVFWYTAIFSTTLFGVLMAMAFAGGGDHSDFDTDMDVDADGDSGHGEGDFKTFTFRNLLNFLLGFSWTGVGLYHHVGNKFLLVLMGVAVGAWFVWFFWKVMRAVVALGRDQTILNEDFIGKTGQVYLTVPGQRSGKGKVLVSAGGSTREFDAVTDGSTIENGRAIEVLEVTDGNTLLVGKVVDS